MSIQGRIRQLAEDIIGCQDDDQTALLGEELQDAIRERVVQLRTMGGAIPLGQRSELAN